MMKTVLVLLISLHFQLATKNFNVRHYVAQADGVTLDTNAVHGAIDACTKNGGGGVINPSGKIVLIGTIYLKDFVSLHIENDAISS